MREVFYNQGNVVPVGESYNCKDLVVQICKAIILGHVHCSSSRVSTAKTQKVFIRDYFVKLKVSARLQTVFTVPMSSDLNLMSKVQEL